MFDRLWVYDGDHRVVSLDPSMNRVEEYAYAPGIDQPIATIRGNTGVDAVGYHVQDELGNILGLIENGAYISQTNSYDAWGTPTETGHAYNNQLKWKGLKWEGDVISLYYMRNRWYDYETGRFMSEDPIGLAGGINMYAFANNDPVNGWDPYGLDCTGQVAVEIAVCDDVTINADWPFSTPRKQGSNKNPSRRGGGWPRGGGDWSGGDWPGPGSGVVEPRTPVYGPSRTARGAACTAAAIDAGGAVAGDLFSLTGFGWIATRGTRGAAVGVKALRASQWLVRDRVGGILLPNKSASMMARGRASARNAAGIQWMIVSATAQGEIPNLVEEVASLVPFINMGLKLSNAVQKCF